MQFVCDQQMDSCRFVVCCGRVPLEKPKFEWVDKVNYEKVMVFLFVFIVAGSLSLSWKRERLPGLGEIHIWYVSILS